MHWLALHFPLLPLEALPRRSSPSAVVGRGRIVTCDLAARAAGVAAGQKLSTALGLAPGLAVHERDLAREAAALDALACWAGRFTPTVVLHPPHALLLDIGGCLRLFGGARAIVDAAAADLAEQGWTRCWAVGFTPLGTAWLAQAGGDLLCLDESTFHAALAALPCAVPAWPADSLRRLEAYGLRRLGELRALPGAGLRQRLGAAAVDDLQRAWGERPDPQRAFVFPERFVRALELPSRVEHAEALVFAGQRLFAALAGWLAARQLRVRACRLTLTHDDGRTTAVPVRFGEPVADETRFLRLLREHLARLALVAPVEALALTAEEVEARPGASLGLFEQAPAGEGAVACLARLQARLGEDAVRVLDARADYRPECASREIPPGTKAAGVQQGPPPGSRPLWLLPQPQALAERDGAPRWHGPLRLLSRPERLESGWWDAGEAAAVGDLRRDYFVAHNPQGQWAWIYRDAQGWFLHGVFA